MVRSWGAQAGQLCLVVLLFRVLSSRLGWEECRVAQLPLRKGARARGCVCVCVCCGSLFRGSLLCDVVGGPSNDF